MNLLLDTHGLIWFLEGDPRLSNAARIAIEEPKNRKWVSVATGWEIAIKSSLGKLKLPMPFNELFPVRLEQLGFVILNIHAGHLHKLYALPMLHRDPFDRLIIAQAQTENLTLVSCDPHFSHYTVQVLW